MHATRLELLKKLAKAAVSILSSSLLVLPGGNGQENFLTKSHPNAINVMKRVKCIPLLPAILFFTIRFPSMLAK